MCAFQVVEQYMIYAVGREDYLLCRVSEDKPRIIAYCTEPGQQRLVLLHQLSLLPRFYTISFRSFSPMPGSLEFQPGQVSTGSLAKSCLHPTSLAPYLYTCFPLLALFWSIFSHNPILDASISTFTPGCAIIFCYLIFCF